MVSITNSKNNKNNLLSSLKLKRRLNFITFLTFIGHISRGKRHNVDNNALRFCKNPLHRATKIMASRNSRSKEPRDESFLFHCI